MLLKILQVAEAQRHILRRLNMPPLESLMHIKHKFSAAFTQDYETVLRHGVAADSGMKDGLHSTQAITAHHPGNGHHLYNPGTGTGNHH